MTSVTSPEIQATAEVLESRTSGWLAQCRELHCAPPFGAWVRAPDHTVPVDERREVIYGVVSKVETAPFDMNRRPAALWTSEDEMTRKHPQIGKLLRTNFHVQCLGWSDGKNYYQSLPPQPPRLHSFVLRCDDDDVKSFTYKHDWIRLLLHGPAENADELLIAVAHHAVRAQGHNIEYSLSLGKTLALLLKDDYSRLRAILGRIGI